jgi:hypothetical protein
VPSNSPYYEAVNTLYQQGIVSGYPCGEPGEPCLPPFNRPYFRPRIAAERGQIANVGYRARTVPGINIDTADSSQPIFSRTTQSGGKAVVGIATEGVGIWGETANGNLTAVYGVNTSGGGWGVQGVSKDGIGVQGTTGRGQGVYGVATDPSLKANGVRGVSASAQGNGVYGSNSAGGNGVFGRNNAQFVEGVAAVLGVNDASPKKGYAAYFVGPTGTSGSADASAGTYTIDHPQDPANKYLHMSAVASPDLMNVYNGIITTDENGEANVVLPDYVEALNTNFCYQLTVIGTFAQAMISAEVKNDAFGIKTDKPNVKVSWQVTGVRNDPFAQQNRVQTEEDKSADQRGYYRHPEVYGLPDSQGIHRELLKGSENMPEISSPDIKGLPVGEESS